VAGSLADKIRETLEPLVGAVLTDVSLDLESKRLGKTPDTLEQTDLLQFAANLENQLRLVVGPSVAHTAARKVAAIE